MTHQTVVDLEILQVFSSTVWNDVDINMTDNNSADQDRDHNNRALPNTIWDEVEYAAEQEDTLPTGRGLAGSKAIRARRNTTQFTSERLEMARASSERPQPISRRSHSSAFADNLPGSRASTHIEALQSSSQRGFSAPPRHEVSTYRSKSLPMTPLNSLVETSEIRDSVQWVTKASETLLRETRKTSVPCRVNENDRDTVQSTEDKSSLPAKAYRKSRFIEHLNEQPPKSLTWCTRTQKRDENNHKWLDLARKD